MYLIDLSRFFFQCTEFVYQTKSHDDVHQQKFTFIDQIFLSKNIIQ